jgi:hypothetical protein
LTLTGGRQLDSRPSGRFWRAIALNQLIGGHQAGSLLMVALIRTPTLVNEYFGRIDRKRFERPTSRMHGF